MQLRRRDDWKDGDDTVEVLIQRDPQPDPQEGVEQIREAARQFVDHSAPMAAIRKTVEERGLDPIWIRLIAEFGSMMYLQGRLSRRPSGRTLRGR